MDGTEQAPPTLLDRIRRRLELSYPWSHTDFRHDGTPVFTQMGNPVEDLKVVLQELDQTRLRLDALTETVAQLTKDLEWSKAETYAIEEGAGEWKARALSAEGQIEALRPAVLAVVDAEEELAGPMPLDMRGRFLADPAESMRATVRATKAGIRARLESVFGNDAGRLSIQARLDAMTGERAADDERLRQAGARVGIWYGCDTPDWLAEEILGLRARLEALEAEHQRLKAVDTPEPWADVFAASKRLVDSPSYAVGAFRALVARAYDWEVAAKARLQAQLTLAESSRASLEAENKELKVTTAWLLVETDKRGKQPKERIEGIALTHEAKDKFMRGEYEQGFSRTALPYKVHPKPLPPSSPSAQEPT